jgi:hypothetical protein
MIRTLIALVLVTAELLGLSAFITACVFIATVG